MGKRKPYMKHWPGKNLGELLNFFESRYPEGYSIEMLSKDLGMTPQNLSQIFIKDDMKLSRAEKIADTLGYRLRLFFPQRTQVISSSVRVRPFPNAGNLSGLARYIADSNISINYMSQRIGKANNVLTNAFNKGDIFISTLYVILKNLNIDAMWEFEKKENN